ncbi:MAG: LuxR C-terminal-related transcriptional regulator [Nodosilinea sp.]
METLGLSIVLETAGGLADATRLLMDLQQINAIVQSFSGCQEPEAIALQTTKGLIEKFDCALARIWLMESDGWLLRLVASAGMYTRTDGFFARVPVGAFKVGKIAQNRIPFLSNHLPEEPWVKDREWAIANHITGFAGYPCLLGDRVVGVLAVFSHHPLSPEFLEALQVLCTTLALALEKSQQVQHALQQQRLMATGSAPLSEQLAHHLAQARLSLVGTERGLPAPQTCLLLQIAELLQRLQCSYCRLSYGETQLTLEAMVTILTPAETPEQPWVSVALGEVQSAVTGLGGTLQLLAGANQKVIQVVVELPYRVDPTPPPVPRPLTSPDLQTPGLSAREREILGLLTEGLRDRDIMNRLYISESTVKFHLNNVLTKLQAKTRCQALYLALIKGWI